MDETIRSILQEALAGDKKEENLMNAYSKLKRGQQSSDQSNPFAADVYVICAETAYQLNKVNVAEECLKMYFQKAESGNECLGRAYMCQAQLNQPESAKFPEQLEKCASFLLKAINFGKANKKHHYLVYNGSVLYWSFARPFLKPNCQHLLAKTLHQIVKALDDTDDKDYDWRAQLMVALIECYLDGGKKEDASQVSTAAASFAKAYCPQMYKIVLSLQVQHKLIDQSKLFKDSKQSTDVAIYLRILKLKSMIEGGEKVDIDMEIDRLYRTIINDGIEPQGTGRSTRLGQITSVGPITQTEKSSLLLDLTKLCLEHDRVGLAEEYVAAAMGAAKDSVVGLEVEFLRSEIVAQKLKEKKSQYTKASVEKRINAIRKLEESLASAIRIKIPTLIQVGCVTMWNLCLPLLQKDFRKAIKAPLNLVAEALEDIDSLLLLMRCQIHIELAKCEEDNEQLESAMNHLRKALELDDTGLYRSRIESSLHRLELRSMLYQLPERPEDIAALVIEQARTTKEAGKLQMKRASLVKAGLALAPDSFGLVMDGESGLSMSRNGPSNPQQLADKVTRYRKSISIIPGHIKRLGNENDRERALIWADLVKTARKQSVWDVTRVAAKFCLLYDDGRWEGANRAASAKDDNKAAGHNANGNGTRHNTPSGKRSVEETEKTSQDDTDLMQIIAEVHFIYAEALVQLLQSEGVKLLESPTPIEDLSTKPKSREGNAKKVEDSREWTMYSEWTQSLSNSALEGFRRGAKLGADLNAPWLVSNAGIYLWNYINHILTSGDYARVIEVFQPIYDNLKNLGYLENVSFFCEFAHALACGYMQRHLPSSRQASPVPGEKEKKQRGGKQSASPTHVKSKTYIPVNDPEAISELKQALEILEHALNLTSGADTRCLVPIANRHPLIKSWVLCKMLAGQLLPKNLGHDDESPNSQGPMSKSLCAIEAHVLQQRYGFDMTNCPGLFETIKLVENCKWTDRLVEIEAWTRLASLASKSSLCQIVVQCGERALELGKMSKPVNFDKLSDVLKHQFKLEQELLYYSSMLMGENLVAIMHGRNETRHRALSHFLDACRFATKARNYRLALNAAQHYWNTCQYFILTPIERKLLKEPIKGILKCITDVWKYSEVTEDEDHHSDDKEQEQKTNKPSSVKQTSPSAKKSPKKGIKSAKHSSHSSTHVRIGGEDVYEQLESSGSLRDSHLALRAAFYGVLFHAYADMGEWKSGLRAMDEAIKVMPRTHHRLLIFKHRVIVNARLGNPVQFDMGKFKDTDELLLSSMWHRVAKNSNDPRDQLIAFQNSIDCLQDPGSKWQKMEYLTEFSEWLFVNEFPLQDCLDHLEIAMELVIEGIKTEKLLMPTSARQDPKDAVDEKKEIEMRTLISDCVDIRSLEALVRIHVMMAQVLENSSQAAESHILTAAYCVQKIWQNAIRNAEKAVRDGVKPGERPFSRTESKRKDINRVEKQISKSCLPLTLEQWVNFTLPEKLKEYFKNDSYGYFISKKSLAKLELTVHYLETLTELLRSRGHYVFILPVCSLLCYIANDVLNDKFMITLSKLQLLDVLNDLQMASAISNVLKSLNYKYLTEEDKAESREEILVWKEKQAQVKFAQIKQEAERETITTADSKSVEFCKNKKLIRGISKREIWTKMAGLLIKQGQFNDVRELLEEAKQSAEAFEDNICLAHVEYNYALIAYHECDWGNAVSHLENIQGLEESLNFWLKVVLLKVDSYQRSLAPPTTFHSHPEVESKDKAVAILTSSLTVIEGLAEKSPNRFSQSQYIKAALKARLADYLLKKNKTIDEKTRIQISELLDESLKTYKSLGFRRDALKCIKHQVYLYQIRASSLSGESRKESLTKCFEISKEAVKCAQETFGKVSWPANELSNICLPIEEELADALLQKMCISLEILKEMTSEEQKKAEILLRKDSMNRLLDDFVAATPVYTEGQADWNSVTSVIGEETLSVLTFIFSSCEKFPKHQGKACLYLGRCLQQIALQRFPDLKEYDASKTKELADQSAESNLQNKPDAETMPKENLVDNTTDNELASQRMSPHNIRRIDRAEVIKQKYAEYSMIVTQAIEYLLLASQIGLRNGFKDIIAKSSYALVECIGARDPQMSAQFLALYQSAVGAMKVGDTAQRLFLDPHVSRVAGLTQQRKSLNEYAPNSNESVGVRALNLEMIQTESEAWRRLHIIRNHLDIIKDLPFPITFVILQHSPDKKVVHAAVLEKPKINAGKKKDASIGATSRSRICSSNVNKDLLNGLKNLAEQFRNDVSSLLLRKRYSRQQNEKRKEMLGATEKASQSAPKETAIEAEIAVEEKRLQSSFEDLIAAMEGYFGKILGQIQDSLMQESVADTIVILADADLLQLPLEALPIFRYSDVKSVSRDFSLQVFYHRITQGELPDQQNGKADKSKLGKKDKVEVKSKSEKTVVNSKKGKTAKELVFGKDGVLLDLSNLRYIIDPSCDWPSGDKDRPDCIMSELMLQLKNKAAKWVGLNGHERIPSVAELQKFIQDSSGLVFYGFERFFAHIPPQFVAPLCLSDCHLIALMDNMKTLKSSLRQGKLDAKKCPTDLALERPLETAITLTLCGAPCILSNQWQCEVGDNKARLYNVIEGLCENSFTVGQALLVARNPRKGKGNEESRHEETDTLSEKASSSLGRHKADGKTSKLQHRTSQAESLRSSKVSSPSSTPYNKRESKQKLESAWKERSERKLSQDLGKFDASKTEDCCEALLPFERYNMVLYGLPNFSTSLQGGS